MAARLEQDFRDTAYRVYVTDSLQAIPQMKYKQGRYIDLFRKEQTVDPEQVARDIVKAAGLVKKR